VPKKVQRLNWPTRCVREDDIVLLPVRVAQQLLCSPVRSVALQSGDAKRRQFNLVPERFVFGSVRTKPSLVR